MGDDGPEPDRTVNREPVVLPPGTVRIGEAYIDSGGGFVVPFEYRPSGWPAAPKPARGEDADVEGRSDDEA
jgi:hypothetical protein